MKQNERNIYFFQKEGNIFFPKEKGCRTKHQSRGKETVIVMTTFKKLETGRVFFVVATFFLNNRLNLRRLEYDGDQSRSSIFRADRTRPVSEAAAVSGPAC